MSAFCEKCLGQFLRDSEVAHLNDRIAALEAELADVRTLTTWRRKAPMIRQWVLGSRFGEVYCRLQSQGSDVAPPFYGSDEVDAMKKAAAWVRENGGGK